MIGLFTIFRKRLEETRRRERIEKENSRTISRDSLRIWLDDVNRLRLFYKDVELTKGCGLSCGILSEGVWYSSTGQGFEFKKVSEDQMRIILRFSGIPIRQEWLIRIDNLQVISFDINTLLKDAQRIDKAKADIFFSKAYSRLAFPLKDEIFPREFGALWNTKDYSEAEDSFIGCVSLKPDYPSICLKSTKGNKNSFSAGNTDSTLSSRVLEAQVEEADEYLKPGTYEHFKILIQLYPDKSVLEDIL
ncbi:MAG: hypothetical protein ABIH27_01390, partial [Candidatus Omnitrophota bacterium]